MTAHTPGPWSLWGSADPSQVIASEVGFVAQTVGGNDEANARLIAAAPDLLSVAYAALDVGERIDHDPDSALGELVAAARIAIAKAKGEQL